MKCDASIVFSFHCFSFAFLSLLARSSTPQCGHRGIHCSARGASSAISSERGQRTGSPAPIFHSLDKGSLSETPIEEHQRIHCQNLTVRTAAAAKAEAR